MSKPSPSPTIVVTDTDRLSALADAILAGAGNPKLTKNTVLNLVAGALAGAKTNWGGLKARDLPLRATAMADDTLSAALDLLFEDREDEAPYRIEAAGLVLPFPPATFGGAPYAVNIRPSEIPALEAALFGKEATGEYRAANARLHNWENDQVVVTARHYDGTPGEICFSRSAFRTFLGRERDRILATVVTDDGIGEAVHAAFIMVAEGQGEDILYDIAAGYRAIEEVIHAEGAEANAARIDRACRDATWLFLASGVGHGAGHEERRRLLRHGRAHELADVVVDYEWELIGKALRATFEAAPRPGGAESGAARDETATSGTWTALYYEGGIDAGDGPESYTMEFDEPVDRDQAEADAEYNLTDNNTVVWLAPGDAEDAFEDWEKSRAAETDPA